MNVALLFGGISSEHEISCRSAEFLEEKLLENKYTLYRIYIKRDASYNLCSSVSETLNSTLCNLNRKGLHFEGKTVSIDFAFSIIHGPMGEDGSLQGFFEQIQLPYAGCNVSASAIAMDKHFMRAVFSSARLPQVKYKTIQLDEWIANQSDLSNDELIHWLEDNFNYPFFIKPCNMGSSVGVHKVKDPNQLRESIDDAFQYDTKVMIEEGHNVREIEVAILGNKPDYQTSVIGEIIPHHEFYSYAAKYTDENGASLKIPADLNEDVSLELTNLAKKAFSSIDGDGFARVDFFIDKDNNQVLLNEINTLPGFTSISMYPKLFKATGINGKNLVKKIIDLGISRFNKKSKLKNDL